jgi:carbonic anhydrase
MTAEEIWKDLVAGNERFRTGQPQPRDLVGERKSVAQAQHPKATILACCDSRVAPEIIFDQKLGDVFVVRAAGCTADALGIGSIEFAAEHFGCAVLVVMGHLHCGAVKAACSGTKVTSPNMKAVVKWIRQAYVLAAAENSTPDLRDVEKLTVAISVQEIVNRSEVLYRLAEGGKLSVIPAYYHLDTGVVERL